MLLKTFLTFICLAAFFGFALGVVLGFASSFEVTIGLLAGSAGITCVATRVVERKYPCDILDLGPEEE